MDGVDRIKRSKADVAGPRAAMEKGGDRPLLAPGSEPGGTAVAVLLAFTVFLAPAIGVPNELMLQDTLKSMVVSFGALAAALIFFMQLRRSPMPVRWHAALALPLLLMAYALGSIAWSHHALASVEAIRWFVFAVLMFLALNSAGRDRLSLLAAGVHAGGAVAALWAALQFLVDFQLFPQGPNPASTFINRNFFAEFAVCTLPFGALLLARARASGTVALLSATNGLVIVAILMTGTRAALMGLWAQLLVVLPFAAWTCRRSLAFPAWPRATKLVAACVLVAVVGGLGAIPTGNASIAQEGRGNTAMERGLHRTASISPRDESLGLRMVMWNVTLRMIADHPAAGVGAGAWEVAMPLYQADDSQLETDYYAHNEFLQLVAEYGLVGWLFLAGLFAWLVDAARRTLTDKSDIAMAERPGRAVVLMSLFVLMLVSNVGFAWRMASTGAMFAICLGMLAASDVRLGVAPKIVRDVPWRMAWTNAALACVAASTALAVYISVQAARSEERIVHAARLALGITGSGDPESPRWIAAKSDMLASIDQGIAINPHYRKITPIVADELARWGDWNHAIPIWQSVLDSRPNIVAILCNVARGYLALGQPDKARPYLERARHIHPNAPAVRAADVVMLARTGQDAQALARGREAIDAGVFDDNMAIAFFDVAARMHDWALAERVMRLRIDNWPPLGVQGWLKLGRMYHDDAHDIDRATDAYRQAITLAPEASRAQLMESLPADVRARLAAQTSASKG